MRKKDNPCLKSEDNGPVMIDIRKEVRNSLLAYARTLTASQLSNNNVVTDPIQLRRSLKNRMKYMFGLVIVSSLHYVFLPIQRLYSSAVDYVTVEIRVKTIIRATTELKEHGLEYTPDALVKYGIIQTEKEPRSNDPEDNRIMRILTKLFNKIKFSLDNLVLIT